MFLAHKIRLDPTKEQEQFFVRACGTSRFTYNWALTECKKEMEKGNGKGKRKFITTGFIVGLQKRWNKEKPDWVYESPKDANQRPFVNLAKAFALWKKKAANEPVFRKKHAKGPSFHVSGDRLKLEGDWCHLPFIGWVRMAELFRFAGRVISASVSCKVDQWFVSINVDVGEYRRGTTTDKTVGIDLGVSKYATLSTGEVIQGTRPYRLLMNRIKRLQLSLSRKKLKSSNWVKTKLRLAKLHARVARIRRDFVNKFTTDICRRFGTIRIEDLNVRGMLKMRSLAQGVADRAFHETRRQLIYKAQLFGCKVELIPRFYPSSKTCSRCVQVKKDLKLSDRIFKCEHCGLEIDRDLNAAYNIATYTDGVSVSACGATGSGFPFKRKVKPVATKQELMNQSSVTVSQNAELKERKGESDN